MAPTPGELSAEWLTEGDRYPRLIHRKRSLFPSRWHKKTAPSWLTAP